MNSDNDLKHSGLVVVGTVDSKLIENVAAHLYSKVVARRIHRQTQLQWNDDCDAVVSYFENVSSRRNTTTSISNLKFRT